MRATIERLDLAVRGFVNDRALEDLDAREKWALVPLVAMAIVMGVAPMFFLRASEKSVNGVREAVLGKPAGVAVER